MSNTQTDTGTGSDANNPMQPACPAFTRWMKRRIARTAARHSAASSAIKQSIATPNTLLPQSTGTPKPGPTNVASHTFAPALPPNAEELHVAALQDLKQRMRCQDAFLQHFVTRLLQDPVVIHTWLTPLPRPHGSSSADTPLFGLGAWCISGQPTVPNDHPTAAQADEQGQPVTWVRPVDDIWLVALQAVRDRHLARHEIELAFVVTMVQSLLVPTAFGLGHNHEDLSLMQHIKAARQACSADCVSEYETKHLSNVSKMEAQAVLLKALLVPDMTDVEAENIHLLQLSRIRHTVERAMQVLQRKWAPPESVRRQTRTCQPNRQSVAQSAAVQKPRSGPSTLNRGGTQ